MPLPLLPDAILQPIWRKPSIYSLNFEKALPLSESPLATHLKTLYNKFNERRNLAHSTGHLLCNNVPAGYLIFAAAEDVHLGVCVLGDVCIAAAGVRSVFRDCLSAWKISISQA